MCTINGTGKTLMWTKCYLSIFCQSRSRAGIERAGIERAVDLDIVHFEKLHKKLLLAVTSSLLFTHLVFNFDGRVIMTNPFYLIPTTHSHTASYFDGRAISRTHMYSDWYRCLYHWWIHTIRWIEWIRLLHWHEHPTFQYCKVWRFETSR